MVTPTDVPSSGEPHGFWCASRLWATGLLAVLIIGTCGLVIYSSQPVTPPGPPPPVHAAEQPEGHAATP